MWTVEIDSRVHIELEDIFYYYLENGGIYVIERFKLNYEHCLSILENNPKFEIRYNQVHCMPIPKFPYMIRF